MGRFLGVFFCVMTGLFVLELLPVGQRYLVAPLTVALTHSCAFIIELLGRELLVDGILIIDNASGFTVQIAAGCNGVEAMILLIAAIVAFPAPWRYKLGG
ncbi:archaeosortase/exosortase family protein [uncultured Gilvimarinus sp.]|uniref:archaeosortase/exosortase family protein n=1 Tax=uncultured Gilvimarinus sp. TaxID=1689143 RepID=UPI0030EDC877|tara:strand:+ start:9527 stop:9826 length:300 start_codon:yes stop_codon:yes gene_type:complete